MAISAKIDSIRVANGHIFIRVGKTEREFLTRAAAEEWADATQEEVKEFLVRLLLAEWRRRNPAANNPSLITNVTATLDLAAGTLNPIKFSS